MAQEVEQFGIKTTIIEPGAFGTNLVKAATRTESRLAEYQESFDAFLKSSESVAGENPDNAAGTVMRVVDAQNPPRHLIIGRECVALVKQAYEQKLSVWSEWENA
jgi:NAD(P)-dependent dehydrogenase (short-subunit alcohol dehydrogenase family)